MEIKRKCCCCEGGEEGGEGEGEEGLELREERGVVNKMYSGPICSM